jgi:hypothetical protein
MISKSINAGWSSPVARQAHNLKVVGSNPAPATIVSKGPPDRRAFLFGETDSIVIRDHVIFAYNLVIKEID